MYQTASVSAVLLIIVWIHTLSQVKEKWLKRFWIYLSISSIYKNKKDQ